VKKKPTPIPFSFVLETLEPCSPTVRPMFGCHAIYVGERIVLILRKKDNDLHDSGVWIATTPEHHKGLKVLLPSIRSIRLFGGRTSSWQNIPMEADDFEESVFTACEMILKKDPRIGKVPTPKKKRRMVRRR
jgi:hypothetical protein